MQKNFQRTSTNINVLSRKIKNPQWRYDRTFKWSQLCQPGFHLRWKERESQWQPIPIPIFNKIPNCNWEEVKVLTSWDLSYDLDGVFSWNWSEPKTAHIDWSNASSPIFRKFWLEFSASYKMFCDVKKDINGATII